MLLFWRKSVTSAFVAEKTYMNLPWYFEKLNACVVVFARHYCCQSKNLLSELFHLYRVLTKLLLSIYELNFDVAEC